MGGFGNQIVSRFTHPWRYCLLQSPTAPWGAQFYLSLSRSHCLLSWLVHSFWHLRWEKLRGTMSWWCFSWIFMLLPFLFLFFLFSDAVEVSSELSFGCTSWSLAFWIFHFTDVVYILLFVVKMFAFIFDGKQAGLILFINFFRYNLKVVFEEINFLISFD